MLDVLSIKYNNIPMVVFKIIALDLLVIRHCRVNCIYISLFLYIIYISLFQKIEDGRFRRLSFLAPSMNGSGMICIHVKYSV